jgi:hypothetical protein
VRSTIAVLLLTALAAFPVLAAERTCLSSASKILSASQQAKTIEGFDLDVDRGAPDLRHQAGTREAPRPAVDPTLIQRGQVQDAIWKLKESGQGQAAAGLAGQVEYALRHATVRSKRVLNEGLTISYILEFSNGMKGVFKPHVGMHSNAGSEVGAFRFDRLLGFDLVPVTTVREVDGEVGSLQLFMPHAVNAEQTSIPRPSARMDLFDYLIQNIDRHLANFMVQPWNGRLVAIDHGLTFFARAKGSRVKELTDAEVRRLMPDPELLGRMRALSRESLGKSLEGVVSTERVDAVWDRLQYFLQRVKSLEHGK